jgi:hypothetical protein
MILLSFATTNNRIPTPEGFAPPAPGMLNDQLDFLIQKYTLQGQNLLVHCRGGVGRAGLVACCWILKMGLCGWVQEPQLYGNAHAHAHAATNGAVNPPRPPVAKTPAEVSVQGINGQTSSPPAPAPITSDRPGTTPAAPAPTPAPAPAPAPTPPIQWNTVDLVERVVRVVRWRRSVKAIETYEQVRFLVEFVEFLRGGCLPTPEVEVEVEVVDPNPNVVVNGYANLVFDEIKENGVLIADGDIHLAMKECGDQEVQGA